MSACSDRVPAQPHDVRLYVMTLASVQRTIQEREDRKDDSHLVSRF